MCMKNKTKLQHVLVESAEEGMHRIKSYKILNKQQERKTKGKKRGVDDSKQKIPHSTSKGDDGLAGQRHQVYVLYLLKGKAKAVKKTRSQPPSELRGPIQKPFLLRRDDLDIYAS